MTSAAVVGVIANPLAGKDIRRLVAEASPTSDMAKVGIVRRAVIGAVEGGARRVILADDRRGIAYRAIDGLDLDADLEVLDEPILDSGRNSQRAAGWCCDEGAGAVIVLGGDGTHRDVAKGWRDAPLVALSTGTNNVFPRQMEATVAGHAAGLVASGQVCLTEASNQAKVINVEVEGVEGDADMALVDVALVTNTFTASRAVWDAASLRELVAAIAEPATVGLSAVAAALAPTGRRDPGGVHVKFGPGESVRAPLAPGLYAEVEVAEHQRLDWDESIEVAGPGSLSFDGERDVALKPGQTASLHITNDGPLVIDVDKTMLVSATTALEKRKTPDGC